MHVTIVAAGFKAWEVNFIFPIEILYAWFPIYLFFSGKLY